MSCKKQMKMVIDQFDSFGYYLNQKLDRDIEENRKGRFFLRFEDQAGNALENVHGSFILHHKSTRNKPQQQAG